MSDKIFRQPSVMNAQQHFSQVPGVSVPRSTFDRSHSYKTTFDAGKLIPFFWDEVLPGDTKHIKATTFGRLATPLHPIMDNLYLDVHWFFVPARLTWENWQKFMGERVNPTDNPNDYSIPQGEVTLANIAPTSAASYFGLPYRAGITSPISISALPFRAYQLIWNQWYRDENLQPSIDVPLDDGPDDLTGFCAADSCLVRNKRKDYFTACLPWPQKGDEVLIPMGDSAPVSLTSNAGLQVGSIHSPPGDILLEGSFGNPNPGYLKTGGSIPFTDTSVLFDGNMTTAQFAAAGATADLSVATAVSINDLRLAIAIQQMLERDARGGTRYIEMIFSQFGVQSDDARLQRPEYLGGSTDMININPVAATATSTSVPQANLAAIGTAVSNSGFTKSFTEHGFLIGIASVRADLTYQQGVERAWFRQTRNDHYFPVFAHLGEQAVLNREIFTTAGSTDDDVFGYQERFAEYRYKPSRITGLMASEQSGSLDVWHLSQEFGSMPSLNSSFITENPPIDRVIAVPSEPHFICDIWIDYKDTRPMPVYSVPGLERL
jgi:hypothetical protein